MEDGERRLAAEYHRGYADALRRRETETWQLDRLRREAAGGIRAIEPEAGGFVKSLAAALGIDWRKQHVTESIAMVRDRLAYLLTGERGSSACKCRKRPDTAEDVVIDLTLGRISELTAVERIREL